MTGHDYARDPARECERRPDRPYDEVSPGTLVMPNGSLVASLDRTFLGGAARLVLAHWDAIR